MFNQNPEKPASVSLPLFGSLKSVTLKLMFSRLSASEIKALE